MLSLQSGYLIVMLDFGRIKAYFCHLLTAHYCAKKKSKIQVRTVYIKHYYSYMIKLTFIRSQ